MRATRLRDGWRAAVNFAFPVTCAGCDGRCAEPGFCSDCETDFKRAVVTCPSCGRALRSGREHLCQRCLESRPPFHRVWACATYSREIADAPLNRAIRRLKYHRDVSFAGPLGQLMADLMHDRCDHDLIVPVPLHVERLRWRGFNQAVMIARPLARRHRRPMEPMALRRLRATTPQVGLDETTRRRNIAGAFAIRSDLDLAGAKVLLVDDVFTTGATVEECSRVLRKGGARQVDVAVLARAC